MKTGLVLEGGGLRGIFTAGVLDVLMEEGVKFDGAVGVSAGAAFGSNYKSEQNRRAIRYNLRFAKDPRYSSIMSLIATGNLFNAQFCYHDIPEKLDPFDWETFRKNPMEFYLVCTDVETGKAVYHLCDNDDEQEMLEWFRASGSMPLVSRIVEIGDKKLLDGGIADSIPLRFMEEQGYERNLVVLTRPANYVKTGNPLMPMIERGLRDYPEGVEAIRNRHIAYNEEVAYVRQREIGKYAFVIRPDRDLDIGRVEHDRTKIRAAYKAGRRKARKLLPEIMTFLEGAKADFSSIKASMVEGDVSVSDVVKPSLVEDPTVVPEEKEGFGKSYEEHPEEISGRENKDIPEELFGKVKRDDTCDGADEEKFEGAPAPAAPAADEKGPDAATADTEAFDSEAADAATADAKPADAEAGDTAAGAEPADAEAGDAKPAGVTSASLVESFGEEPAETAPEQDEDQKVRVQEVRAVILPEEEEELPAFQRPFPMDREPDRAAFAQDNDVKTEAAEDTPDAEAVEEPAEETETAEADAPVAEEPAEEEPKAEEPAAEETKAEAEEPAAEETKAEAEEPAAEETKAEAEEPAAEETKVEAEEPAAEETKAEAEEPAAEEATEEASFKEAAAENAAKEAETGEAAAENVAEEVETEEAAAEEPAEEDLKAEEPAAEEPAEEELKAEEPAAEGPAEEELKAEEPAAEEPAEEAEAAEAEKPVAEEAKAEEPAAEEPALEEPAVEAEESAEAVAVEHTDASEASVEADAVEEADGSNPFRYRKKGRKQKKVWKPGNMTALKEKAKDQTK